jgi:hypothetical protein
MLLFYNETGYMLHNIKFNIDLLAVDTHFKGHQILKNKLHTEHDIGIRATQSVSVSESPL